jgi:hypothetical protein
MRNLGAAAVLILLAAPFSFAGWIEVPATGCKALVGSAKPGATASWTGACREGQVQGGGILLTDDGTRLEGEFKDGEPWNAHGYQVYQTRGGKHVIANWSITNGTSFISPLRSEKGQSRLPAGVLAGEWNWESVDGKCREKYRYGDDFQMRIESGAEVLEGAFELLRVAAPGDGFLELRRLNIKSNGLPDCQGNLTAIGGIRATYLRFIDKNAFQTCGRSDESTCFGVARRASPAAPAN